MRLRLPETAIDFAGYPRIMGIVNVTPDSFSDGGLYLDASSAVEHGRRLINEGADILDIGGESTRPGSDAVSAAEQIDRVVPVIERLREADPAIPISIDTRLATVAETTAAAGAVLGICAWLLGAGALWLLEAALIGVVVPYTLAFMLPLNRRLMSATTVEDSEIRAGLVSWARRHSLRTVLGAGAFLTAALALA